MNEKTDRDQTKDEEFTLSSDQSFNLLESISEAFYGLDSDWRFIYLNRKAEQLWGRKREELIGKHIWTEFPQGVNTQAYREMHRALEEQQTIRFETFSSFLEAWVEVEVYPTRTGLSVYFHNITRRKEAEAALEKSQQQLRLITESLPLLISYIDNNMHYQFVNNGYEKLFELDRSQIVGKHITEIIGQTAFETVRPDIEAALSGQTVRYERPMPYSTGTRLTRTQLLPHRLADGSIAGLIVMVDDITDRQQIDEELAHLAAIVGSSNDAIVSETLDGIITSWNQGAEKIFGYTAREVIQKPISILIPPDKLGEEKMLLRKIAADETIRNYDTIRLKKDRSEIFVSVSLSPLKDGQEKIVGASKIAQDVTERKRAEDALRRYGERMTAINHLDYIISSNLDINQVYDNFVKELQTLVPLDRTAIVRLNKNGDQWQVVRQWTQHEPLFFPGEWRPLSGSVIEWLVTNRIPYSESEVGERGNWPETAILQREGIRSRILLPLIIKGEVAGVLTVGSRRPSAFSEEDQSILMTFADHLTIAIQNSDLYEEVRGHAAELEQRVTERTAELNAAKQRVEAILNSGTDAILLVHRDFTIQQTNDSFNRMFGCEQDDYFEKSLKVLLSPNNENIITKLEQAATARNKLVIDVEALRKDGTVFAAEISLGFITDNSFVCTFHDINERKALEQSLLAAVQKEKELNELKTRFVSMASHEFRTPLATIRAISETLIIYRDRLSDDQISQKLSNTIEQIDFLTDIVNDVLQLARLQARRFDYKPSKLNLDTLWREILDEYQNRQDIHHQFYYSSEKSLPFVQVDKKLMRQIITNLLSNAIKYSSPDKPITITLEHVDNRVCFSVQDEGIGIPEDDLSHLFESFHRADNVGTIHGTGLGLVIAKEAVELHGGTITVVSKVGRGTTFTVHIPLTD